MTFPAGAGGLATAVRTRVLAAGMIAAAGAIMPGHAAAAVDDAGNFAFSRSDEADLQADDPALPPRARDLIRIGEVGIAKEDDVALEEFFHPAFRFHGPGSAELDRQQLWSYFAACRAAFDEFAVTRQMLLSDGGDHMAARTRFSGLFVRPFTGLPGQQIAPNGKRVSYTLINIFRYAPTGQLIEEWAQYDLQDFLDQLQE